MKKVLIAIDYNPTAQKIAETGYSLAKSMNAEITLVHVVADYTYYSSLDYSPIMGFDSFSTMGMVQTNTVVELEKAAHEYLEKTKKHLGDTSIKTLVKDGDSGDAIIEAANEIKADVIVLGSHSRRGLDKILMGSVAEKVLRHSKVPLFIIPVSEKEKK
ncbi:MAG TPA: universal stress protein [Hanamia sp.]|nr:universal stress protein [Hanamia sp.]